MGFGGLGFRDSGVSDWGFLGSAGSSDAGRLLARLAERLQSVDAEWGLCRGLNN